MTPNTQLLDGMVIFAEVVNAGSFTAAADNTAHSTSYISKEINKLEQRLGVRLLNRTTRSIGLTPEGKVYFQMCEQIISDAEQAVSQVNQQNTLPKGLLKISCPVSFGISYLSPILADYLALYPEVKLDLDLSDRQVDVIADGFDVVIRASNQLEDSTLISRPILKSRGYTVASPEYLQKRGIPQNPEDLAKHDCLCYSPIKQPQMWSYQKNGGEKVTVEVPQKILCNSAEMELSLVLAGHGITRLPGFNIKKELVEGKLIALFEDVVPTQINLHAVYASRKHLSPKVRSFIDFLVEHIED